MKGGCKNGRVRYTDPLDVDCRGCCRNLRSLIRPNLGPAATHLFHVPALPVHGTTAGTLLMTHHHACQTGHDRGRCGEQQEDRNDAGETSHDSFQYTSDLARDLVDRKVGFL
jgi:hypothetical protein